MEAVVDALAVWEELADDVRDWVGVMVPVALLVGVMVDDGGRLAGISQQYARASPQCVSRPPVVWQSPSPLGSLVYTQ
jgi:hypothetical protein